MKTTKTMLTALMAVALWLAGGARAAEVKNVTAAYAWPWGAEIRYEVAGTLEAKAPLAVTATDRANNSTYPAEASALSGDTGSQAGVHHLMWDLDKQGVKIQSTNVVFTVTYEPLYIVVDLSGGTNAASYPVTGMDVPPSGGFNTDAYKTTKLVLRKIPAGTFTMGSPSDDWMNGGDEDQHKVTLTKPFYIGLFEVTQKQYQLVKGYNPSEFSGDKRPVESVSYSVIRGPSEGAKWPASDAVDADSFLGKLRAKTGLTFDLPTEAQWEYACRAGTTTAYSYGGSANGDYMWYNDNQSHDVGTKKANPWGLYDMHGNVFEWCLDWYKWSLGTAAATDPKGASSTWYGRVYRGGSWMMDTARCRSADRETTGPEHWNSYLGFRLSRVLSE